jgi:hypothetical protein
MTDMTEEKQPDTPIVTPEQPDAHEEEFMPRGAFRFALLLIVGYIIYYFLHWYEIVILRGGGV